MGKPGSGKAVAGKGASAKPQSARPRPMTRSASGQGDHGGAQRAPADFAGPSASSAEPKEAAGVAIPRRIWTGNKPAERVPVILETTADGSSAQAGYHLIDSGDGVKLEQYGPYRIVRPEAQALWPKALDDAIWERADAIFTGDTDEDGMGRWRFPGVPLGETWPMRLLDTEFLGRFTAFRHVGVFPEQLAHWRWVKAQIEAARAKGRARPVRVLNLFGYTGVASLIAANAGAEVTHVDASKKAIGWARENQALGRGDDLPIRWICDDAMKFIQREERRGSAYDIILTDPPKFGRGPNGEVWHLFDHLPAMLDLCRAILSPEAIGLVLTAYSIRASFYSIHELMRETMRGAGGRVESGELILREAGLSGDVPGRALSTSLFSRWIAHDE
ncbi:SAM-dependent methyltransferase [Xaviernesmea oryzae]|uniref:SAM-dependent methyltransferase n=1 Tax=Xaviernesmea oryzae TaxID=464029 RepID=A0A1Q9AV38_9HYPH|nr:SAM-dependent methyltransferase [Xaviernesmea oryzae]